VSAVDVSEQQQAEQQGDVAGLPTTGVYHQLSFGIWGQEVMRKVGSEGRISFETSPRFDSSRQQQQRRLQHQSSFGFGLPLGNAAAEVQGSNPGVSRSSSGSSDAAGKGKAAAWQSRQQWWQQALSNMVQSLQLFWSAVKQPHVLRPVMFLFLWQVSAAECATAGLVEPCCGCGVVCSLTCQGFQPVVSCVFLAGGSNFSVAQCRVVDGVHGLYRM
jgi:hypothetical protein